MSQKGYASVASICSKVCSGGTPSRSNPEYWTDGTIPWMKTGELKQGTVFETEERITQRGFENSSVKLIPTNSVLVAMYGDGDTAGSVAINKIDLTTNQACCNLIIDPEKADYRYVYYYLRGSYDNLVALKLGGSQQNLNAATIRSFPIRVPGVGQQRKIAAVLAAYDDLIEANRWRIALLERMAEEIYREWFVRLRFPGYTMTKITKGLPTEWEIRPFSDVVSINPTERIDKEDERPFVAMEELSESSMYFTHKECRKGHVGPKFRNGDVLFPRITPSVENGKRGLVMTLAAGEVAQGSTEFIVMREKVLTSEHIYFLSVSEGFRTNAELSMTGASGRQRVQEQCFNQFLVKVPPPALLEEFTAMVRPMVSQIRQLSIQTEALTRTRDLLLPRLISGKLAVDDLDITFPPSMAG